MRVLESFFDELEKLSTSVTMPANIKLDTSGPPSVVRLQNGPPSLDQKIRAEYVNQTSRTNKPVKIGPIEKRVAQGDMQNRVQREVQGRGKRSNKQNSTSPQKPAPSPTPPVSSYPSNLERLYEATTYVETGGEQNPWIRTKVIPKGGSTAYGPGQLTATTALDFIDRYPDLKKQFPTMSERIMRQQKQFRLSGNVPKTTKGYDPRHDYGGEGTEFVTPEDREMYENFNKEVLKKMYEEQGEDINKTINRYNPNNPEYMKKVLERYNQTPE